MHWPRACCCNRCSIVRAEHAIRFVAGAALSASLAACSGSGSGPSVRVTIPQHSTLRVAADSLAKAGVIRNATFFRVYASLRHGDRGIKAGTYLLHKSAGWAFVLDALRGGKGLVHVVTIPEGFSLSQIEPLLASRLGVPPDSVEAAVLSGGSLNPAELDAILENWPLVTLLPGRKYGSLAGLHGSPGPPHG